MANKVDELCSVLNLNLTELSMKLGVTHSALSQMKAKNKMSSRMIATICAVFPHINREYLEKGEGSVLMGSAVEHEEFKSEGEKNLIAIYRLLSAEHREELIGLAEFLLDFERRHRGKEKRTLRRLKL